jgi:hypothetical protein
MKNMADKECKIENNAFGQHELSVHLRPFVCVFPSTAITVTAWWIMIQFPVWWLNFRQG